MAGKEKGVAARIRKKFPKMPFVHCHHIDSFYM